MNERFISLIDRKLSILELAYIISKAKCFIGIDSGFAHFANAFDIPSVIILGEYRLFKKYMPYSGSFATRTGSVVIQNDGPASFVAVEDVCKAFDAIALPKN